MTLSLGTAYRSFGGEMEASSTPMICRLLDSCRHQLSAIAPDLLRNLASESVQFIEQSSDGTVMLAEKGELTVQSRNFFAVFESADEWRLTVGGRTLGTLPIS